MNTGLDPEILAVSDGLLVPAEYFMPPPKRDDDGILNELSYDNAAVEMRPTHSTSAAIVKERLKYLVLSTLFEMDLARDYGQIPSNTELMLIPAAMLAKEDQEIESVSVFGCSPSYTIDDEYRRCTVTGLVGPDETRFRSAGFHIHQELPNLGTVQAAVAVLDGILGLTDVLVNEILGFTEFSKIRRCTIGYGIAGEHRTRTAPGGVTILEYRALSPWPIMAPQTSQWVMEVARQVAEQNAPTLGQILGSYPKRKDIIHAINQSKADDAADLLKECTAAFESHAGGLNANRQQFHQLLRSGIFGPDINIGSRWGAASAHITRRRGIDTRRKSND